MNAADIFRETMESEEIPGQCPDFLLAQGEHMGFTWVISHNGYGFRCGYVRLPPGHPWYGLDRAEIPAEVHGSVTFTERSIRGNYWIGFDMAHARDLPDPDLPVPPYVAGVNQAMVSIRGVISDLFPSAVRTQEYVEAECRSLCEQAAAAAEEGGGRCP